MLPLHPKSLLSPGLSQPTLPHFPGPSLLPASISLDNHKPLLTAEEIYSCETKVPIDPLCCISIYILSNHMQPAFILHSWRHKAAIRLICSVDRELREKAPGLLHLCVRASVCECLCAYVRAKTLTFDEA